MSASAHTFAKLAKIPPLLYGTAWKGEATTSLVFKAFKYGFRGIDTAAQRKHYREDLVGLAVEEAEKELGIGRELLWLQTKFTPISGQDLTGPMPYDPEAKIKVAVRESFESSLRNLHRGEQWIWEDAEKAERQVETERRRRPWIDSYLLHSPLNTLEETLQAWTAMEDLVLEGKVRQIGFSNVYDARIFNALRSAAKRVGPKFIQNRWHHTSGHDVSLLSMLSPVLSPNDFPLLDPANPSTSSNEAGITYQPFWTLTGNPMLLKSEAVQIVAVNHDWTTEQVVYRFCAQNFGIPGLQVTVLCGTTDDNHMTEAVEAVMGEEMLSIHEVESIRKVVYGE
ncbi:hypothetical protein CBS101457_004605 [Exobasidium rhododendri]|nr:hypothetical protein CBS101457_004605 [Exobasidium rhododendri]